MRQFFTHFVFLFSCMTVLRAQTPLLSENFDACTLPAGWEVKTTGNPNPVWYVGATNLNNDNNGQSMNGSCFLFIDDDATGNNTPAYVIDFISPVFDASQFPKVEMSVDVHYRDWADAQEYFDVLVTDGVTETLIRRYDKSHQTGTNLYDFETLTFDLTLVTQSPNARLIFRYDDAGGFNWWAGIDNVSVTGIGQGTNLIIETFNDCAKPAGWQTEVLTGVDDWKFGLITEGKALSSGNSMNGSCFVFFDDDLLGQDTPYSTVRLISPWFDGTKYGSFTLDYDVILRYYKEKIAVFVQNGDGEEFLVNESAGDVGGPFFPNFVHSTLDLSPFRSQQMRVIFQYDDGKSWGWWAGLDNVKISGSGPAIDICSNAQPLISGQSCLPGNNFNSLLDGPAPGCVEKSVGGLWYRWTADFDGTAELSTNATFNEVVEIFTGSCSAPQPLLCNNRDEHGFTAEKTWFQAQNGAEYLIRVSGREGGFGVARGSLCVGIQQAATPPPPANDDCSTAQTLVPDQPCQQAVNLNGSSSATIPAYNELARHDVWYSFTAPPLSADEVLVFESNADFSDIITLYSGNCQALTEVASNYKGRLLEMPALNPGETYLLQIAGTFATVEGSLCSQIYKKNVNAPTNDLCAASIPVTIGAGCVSGTTAGATYSGQLPPCVPYLGRDVWYSFVAPGSGSVKINTNAEFPHVLAVWKGDCNGLENVLCAKNPLRCDGYLTLGALSAGEIYYVQIGTLTDAAGIPGSGGQFCLDILDGSQQAPFSALQLHVEEKCVSSNVTKLFVSAQGGVEPYSFEGSDPAQLLNSGDKYLIILSDAMGCVKTISGAAEDCEALACNLTGTISSSQPHCHDMATGAMWVMVTGGTAPYTYKWSNEASTMTINQLAPGATYSVTATDALGCDITFIDSILNPEAITIVPNNIQQPHQGQSDGVVMVDISGGTGAYSYTWTRNGAFYSNNKDLIQAPAGDYVLGVEDSYTCFKSFQITLSETVANQEVSTAFYTEIFPNPAHEKAWLAASFPKPATLYLSLHDGGGKTLQAWSVKDVTEQNIPLDLKGLPAGTYRLRIWTGDSWITEKVVVGN